MSFDTNTSILINGIKRYYMYGLTISVLLTTFFWSTSCGGEKLKEAVVKDNPIAKAITDTLFDKEDHFVLPYDVNEPDKTLKLANEIREISGLSRSKNPGELLSVNDEKGIAYVLNRSDGAIVRKYRFDKNKDYEGIESVDDKIYVVESNGTLYQINNPGKTNQTTERIHTPMSFKNDIEGLGFDPVHQELILACKANGNIGENKIKGRAFYKFSLKDHKLKEDPFFHVSKKDINAFYVSKGLAASKHHLRFEPSAVAIHPTSHHIYALASAGKKLIVFDKDTQNILHITILNPKLYKQPEGICFLADGTMYISSEGQGGKARLFELRSN